MTVEVVSLVGKQTKYTLQSKSVFLSVKLYVLFSCCKKWDRRSRKTEEPKELNYEKQTMLMSTIAKKLKTH